MEALLKSSTKFGEKSGSRHQWAKVRQQFLKF
jgi:hypothetical protein